jgi:hypothetical protein
MIRVSPQNDTDVELIAWPDATSNELSGPGDGLVVRAVRDAALILEVVPSAPGGTVDAELRLEPVSRLVPSAGGKVDRVPQSGDIEADVEILAHVARRGDVVVSAGQWICGPDYPMPIEGIEMRWPGRPAGLDVVTSVSIRKNGIRNLPPALTGEFAGTRGRAAPITSLEISLTGERARDYELKLDALFLGSAVQSRRGQSISLIGPTGREPLVGFRASITPAHTLEAPPRRQAVRPRSAESKGVSTWASGARVRVFRGLGKGGQESRKAAREPV